MGVKKPVDIGGRHFEKQGDALSFFKGILWKYKLHESLDSADQIEVGHLIKRHKDYALKVGAGIDHFIVMLSDEGSRCLGVVRVDGTKIGFSYRRCVTQLWE